jgi:hypothetical protein
VLEGRGFVHALFVALQTEVKVLVIVFFPSWWANLYVEKVKCWSLLFYQISDGIIQSLTKIKFKLVPDIFILGTN